jgi:N-dimethylarginine dimethylaminohydrolase
MLPKILNETSRLRVVVLGIADDFGGTPTVDKTYDPKSKEHVLKGTYPVEEDLLREIEGFKEVLEKYGVEVLRPVNIKGVNQIFTRDIGFVVDNIFVIPNIIEDRHLEGSAVADIVKNFDRANIIKAPNGARLEGGDVMPWNKELFVGYSEQDDFEKYKVSRTNRAGVEFLVNEFPGRQVHAFELNKSDDVAEENALHLDCCFQPIGYHQAIIYQGGFKHQKDFDFLVNYFGREHIIEITRQEMYEMNSNVFSISPQVIVSGVNFTRLNQELRHRGFIVEEVEYDEVAKMEGLLRCSTMPLIRD